MLVNIFDELVAGKASDFNSNTAAAGISFLLAGIYFNDFVFAANKYNSTIPALEVRLTACAP